MKVAARHPGADPGDDLVVVGAGGPVRVEGVNYPVVGRIAMDQMVIDLGDAVPAGAGLLGAEAEIFGSGSDGGPTADDWALAAGTNNYEIVTRISPRVPRRFINEAFVAPGAGKQPTR